MGNSAALTIGVSVSLWGNNGYGEFIERWWQGVKRLKRQPDAIVFAHDELNRELVRNSVPEQYKPITNLIEMSGTFGDFMNAIQSNQKTDWISICNIDDEYLPEAFDQIEQADAEGCDILIDKLRIRHNGEIMSGKWIPELIPKQMTCPGAAPIKRSLYEKTGGHSSEAIYDDWDLYIRCVKAGAKPFHADTVRAIHDLGIDRVTLSGVNRVRENDAIEQQRIANLRAELGL